LTHHQVNPSARHWFHVPCPVAPLGLRSPKGQKGHHYGHKQQDGRAGQREGARALKGHHPPAPFPPRHRRVLFPRGGLCNQLLNENKFRDSPRIDARDARPENSDTQNLCEPRRVVLPQGNFVGNPHFIITHTLKKRRSIMTTVKHSPTEYWEPSDLLFLKDTLEHGMTCTEVAGFLSRDEDEVCKKAEQMKIPLRRLRHWEFDRLPRWFITAFDEKRQ
jgi:hypothetical protein